MMLALKLAVLLVLLKSYPGTVRNTFFTYFTLWYIKP